MDYMKQVKSEIYKLTNEFRKRAGLHPVQYSYQLDCMGQIHTNEMYTHHFFSHVNLYCKKVKTLSDRVSYCGLSRLYDMYGENIADYPAVDSEIIISSLGSILNGNKDRPLLSPYELCKNVVTGWYNSPGHKVNLLCPEYDYVGFGLLLYPKYIHGVKLKYLLATQNFGQRASRC
jgi:uncharacterized protein YkwD